ncbi:MAG: hypothetical protein P1S60_06030 [Anaerolineae bacterium]|nr:hypothetical protein [Anaerolineae bacterium]
MIKRKTASFFIISLLVAIIAVPVLAQNYSFSIPKMLLQVELLPDASARLIYDITFDNYGSPIDIVDIGLPHDNYSIQNMRASIKGVDLSRIYTSEYIDVGVEIHLGNQSIPSGEQGTLHFEATMPDMIYADTTDEENASLQISPTWFDSGLLRGTGDIEIRVTMLEGIELDEVLWQDVEFSEKVVDNSGRVVAVWLYENVQPSKAYRVGVSFPRQGLDRVVEITFWDILGGWIAGISSALAVVAGMCLPLALPAIFIFFFVRAIVRASKPKYLPAIAQVEGGGIKRGLTAPEAGIILELPLTKVLLLVIFGMLEKGLIRQTKEDPLTVEVTEDFKVKDREDLKDAGEKKKHRSYIAQQKGTVIHSYEHAFLDLFEDDPETPVKSLKIVGPMQGLANHVAAKMKGFDLSDTQEYYRRVIERAMEQANTLGEIGEREAYLDQYLPWVMMNRSYRPVLTVGGYNYWPRWARQTSTAASVPVTGGRGSGRASSPKFGDVAASFSGWTETTLGGMAAAIMPTRLSKPAPPSTSSSSGGFRSSCACACAGCACACACAGGGR